MGTTPANLFEGLTLRSPAILLSLFALRVALLAPLTTPGCGSVRVDTTRGPHSVPEVLFVDSFQKLELVQQHWSAVVPEIVGAATSIEDGEARLTLPSPGEVTLVHPLDVTAVRGKRLRVSVRIRTDGPEVDARVAVAFGGSPADFRPRVRTSRAPSQPTSLAILVDVALDISRAELSLVLSGPGNAWFDDIKVEILEPQAAAQGVVLSRQQLEDLEVLTRTVAFIRYRHPSDQAAGLDWNAFFPVAIDRVLHVANEDTLLAELRDLFARVAPAVVFSRTQEHAFADLPPPASGHLVRWRHEGLGPHAPFKSWREGRDRDLASFEIETPVDLPGLAHCKKAQLRASAHGVHGEDEARAFARVELPGDAEKRFDHVVGAADSAISLDFDVPADAYRVYVGIELRGRSSVTLEAVSLKCDDAGERRVDLVHAPWEPRGAINLYGWEVRGCGGGPCLVAVRRPLDTTFTGTRDVLTSELRPHLWIQVPLAVWADGVRTLPETAAWVPPAPGTATNAAERIATLASAWMTLSTFYPGFQDQKIDWAKALPGALTSGAAARSTHDTYIALSRLIAQIHDGHARAIHADFPIDGMLPIAMRTFGNKLVVVGGYADFIKRVPIGTEILAIDHTPVIRAYQQARERISSSTAGWEAWAVPFWLTLGPLGSFSMIHVRTVDSREMDVLLPRLSRDLYSSLVREPRPALGAVLAPGIHYVDLEDLKPERWQAALPSLVHAQAILLDMRGYPSNAVFTMLGHFIDKEIRSPRWQTPILESSGYQTSYWTVHPTRPRIDAKLVVLLDGRAASAAETFLQMVQDNHLAVFVGEPSAGTNGNPNRVALPGSFTLRFTGDRVPLADGSALQGRGIVPDVIVHPTLAAVRAGRDEILEAGLRLASTLIAK